MFLVIQAVQRLLAPQPIEHSLEAMIVMCVSIFAAICLILYERSVVARTGSVAVTADATHYFGDLVSNIGVVVAILLVSWLGWLRADPIIALAGGAGAGGQRLERVPPEPGPVDGPRTAR